MAVGCCEMVKFLLIIILFVLVFFSGCITNEEQLQKKIEECRTLNQLLKTGEIATCYHEVAVSYALKAPTKKDDIRYPIEKGHALNACEQIALTKSWFVENEQNNCYADIADILNDETICERIVPTGLEKYVNWLPFEKIYSFKEHCIEKAKPKAQPDICSAAVIPFAILFLALGAGIFYRK